MRCPRCHQYINNVLWQALRPLQEIESTCRRYECRWHPRGWQAHRGDLRGEEWSAQSQGIPGSHAEEDSPLPQSSPLLHRAKWRLRQALRIRYSSPAQFPSWESGSSRISSGGRSMLTVRLRKPITRKIRLSCYRCLDGRRIELRGRVYCFHWETVVSCGHAKICPYFTPNTPLRRSGRKRKVRRW